MSEIPADSGRSDPLPTDRAHQSNDQAKAARLNLIAERSTAARTIFIDTLIVASLLAVILVTVSEVFQNAVVMEAIDPPAKLVEMGYSEEVAANRLIDQTNRIYDEMIAGKEKVNVLSESQLPEISEPGSGISLRGLAQTLRAVLGLEQTRVAGEFVCRDEDCTIDKMELRLRLFRNGEVQQVSAGGLGKIDSEEDIDDYFRRSAVMLLRVMDPMTAASYLADEDRSASERMALQIFTEQGEQSAAAAMHIGSLKARDGDQHEAEIWFEQALLSPTDYRATQDGHTLIFWGRSLIGVGNTEIGAAKINETIEKLDGASRSEKREKCGDINNAMGFAYLESGNSKEAIGRFKEAITCNPKYVSAYNGIGDAYLKIAKGSYDLKKAEKAIEYYSIATEMMPNDPFAYASWGDALYWLGDDAGAEQKFRTAVLVSRNDLELLHWLAGSLYSKGNYRGATTKYKEALSSDSSSLFVLLDLSGSLVELSNALIRNGKFDEAIDRFEEAITLYRGAGHVHPESAVLYARWGGQPLQARTY